MHTLTLYAIEGREVLTIDGRIFDKIVQPLFQASNKHGCNACNIDEEIGISRCRCGGAINAESFRNAFFAFCSLARAGTWQYGFLLARTRNFTGIDTTFARDLTHLSARDVRTNFAGMAECWARVFAGIEGRFAYLATRGFLSGGERGGFRAF